ncbi:putative sensor protein [Haloterrigena turkmenica DSM 5511]|uniref:Sensor protein n=1 Tax=Haloterrigena turkmenica (strain ATCC 51198 / DSM 5511 / JCM 9101 / NCIMB 13204 / VKM B-1734 / 4k) TaxID=543526 RepID=D2RPF1_HALTV|nr:DICT sensory domain-containing protein [Haloterrigena turkmenica]ADB60185.1 putative sensor protein [Haloterrigena turkmenica DSM 5511]
MNGLRDQLDEIEAREQILEVHTDVDRVAAEFERQFSSRNVRVVRRSTPAVADRGFAIIRDGDREFRGAIGIEHFRTLLSPEIHPPWALENADVDYADLFEFLDNTLFTSYNRRQMLAASREIEERAWRTDAGALFVGFQNASALASQRSIYERLGRERTLDITIFVEDEYEEPIADGIDVVSTASGEIGAFWFVIFDGGGSDLNKCGLLAEERDPGQYYGFWTYDPERIDEIVAYLGSLGDP